MSYFPFKTQFAPSVDYRFKFLFAFKIAVVNIIHFDHSCNFEIFKFGYFLTVIIDFFVPIWFAIFFPTDNIIMWIRMGF